ncbi:hypothetical protein LINGRAHAP2_LOCUS4769, partial [Linum grandiflorum]
IHGDVPHAYRNPKRFNITARIALQASNVILIPLKLGLRMGRVVLLTDSSSASRASRGEQRKPSTRSRPDMCSKELMTSGGFKEVGREDGTQSESSWRSRSTGCWREQRRWRIRVKVGEANSGGGDRDDVVADA